jgi:ATP-dependent DNA ligase
VRFHNCPGCQRHVTANATEELKLDGYRSIAFKTGGKVYPRSRNDKDFNATYPDIVKALAGMPDETVIDGEIVALDQAGRPSFTALQHYGSGNIAIVYYVFDVMVLGGCRCGARTAVAPAGIAGAKDPSGPDRTSQHVAGAER